MAENPVAAKKAASSRNMGIELLRIVSTVMVILLHCLGCSYLLGNNYLTNNGLLIWLIEALCYCAVNCFGITSGYVSCTSKFRLSRIIKLWAQMIFVSVIVTFIFEFINPEFVNKDYYIEMITPLLSNSNWYFTAFFGLFFFSPILNILMQNLTKAQHKYLVIVSLLLFCIPACIPEVGDLFKVGGGYSMLWLMCMYILGGYIKLHGINLKVKKSFWIILYFISSVVAWGSVMVIARVSKESLGKVTNAMQFLKYTSPLIVLSAVSLFMFFSQLNIKKGTKVIGLVAPLTFGIFITHTHDLYWKLALVPSIEKCLKYDLGNLMLWLLLVCSSTFIICGVFVFIQQWLFKVLQINTLCELLDKKLVKLHNTFNSPEKNHK